MNREVLIRLRTARLLDAITSVEIDPTGPDPISPTVQDMADEIARFVLELEDGPARGLLHEVSNRLVIAEHERMRAEIKSATGGPIVEARRVDRAEFN